MLRVKNASKCALRAVVGQTPCFRGCLDNGDIRRRISMISEGQERVDQLIPPPGHSLLIEGQAAIPFENNNSVFYNKVQEFNRDLSIHVVKLFAEKRLREKTEQALRKARKVCTTESSRYMLHATRCACWRHVSIEHFVNYGNCTRVHYSCVYGRS